MNRPNVPLSPPMTPESTRVPGKESQILLDRYKCPGGLADFDLDGNLSRETGYFRLGEHVICYGQCASGAPQRTATEPLHDAGGHVAIDPCAVHLPFDAAQVVDNLRYERYVAAEAGEARLRRGGVRSIYYFLRPALGVSVRKHLQRRYFRGWEKIPFPKMACGPHRRGYSGAFAHVFDASAEGRAGAVHLVLAGWRAQLYNDHP